MSVGRVLGREEPALVVYFFAEEGEGFCAGDAYLQLGAGRDVADEGYRAVGLVPRDGGACAVPGLFYHHVAGFADPQGVVLAGNLLESFCQDGGTFVLDAIRYAKACIGLHSRGGRTRPGDKAGDVAYRRASFFEQPQCLAEVAFRFAGVAYNQVGTEGGEREARVEFFRESFEFFGGMPPVHRLQDGVATALYGYVYELVEAIVLEAFEQCVRITAHVSRISHAKAHLVIARYVHEGALHKGSEICTDIEPVARAVLA